MTLLDWILFPIFRINFKNLPTIVHEFILYIALKWCCRIGKKRVKDMHTFYFEEILISIIVLTFVINMTNSVDKRRCFWCWFFFKYFMFGHIQWTFDMISIWIIIVVNWLQSCIPDTEPFSCIIGKLASAWPVRIMRIFVHVQSILNLVFNIHWWDCGEKETIHTKKTFSMDCK